VTNVQQDGRVALITGAGRGIVAAQAVLSVSEELRVSTVPDAADIYRTEPAEGSAGVAGSEA
jgi:NAD(P)-dependent dehydrogenase (short-subunit alcohol dehydrogenase family)